MPDTQDAIDSDFVIPSETEESLIVKQEGMSRLLDMTESEKRNDTVRIFVLADTHNHLPDKILELATGADEIWHLGDVCSPSLIEKLETLGKPLLLVRGNCDSNFQWPLVVDQQRNGLRFRLVHIPPTQPPANIDVLLHGHTHVPCNEVRQGVRFLNPGCVTRPNQGAPASVAFMEVSADGKLQWRLKRLR